jgi:hypothetical protein
VSLTRRAFLQLSAGLSLVAARRPLAAAPARKRRADSFLGIHFDFHAGPDSTAIGARTTRAMIEAVIDAVGPDYIQVDCKGHRGLSSYPTKVGHQAPGFVGDQLRQWREVTAERGVALFVHYSGIWDAEAVERHPDWAVVNADGTRDDRMASQFGPYVDRLLIPQMKELIDVYGIDGAWIDGECWAVKHDYAPDVLDRFREATGIDAVPRSAGEPHFFEFTEFCREGFREYVRHYVRELHAHRASFEVTSNWAFSDHMPEPVTIDLDFLSGDYSLNDSVNSARLAGRCIAAQGAPWDLMAWSFGGRFQEGAWTQKSVPQLQREAAVVLALGGGFQAYFTQMRDAAVRTWQLPLMRDVAAFCRARQPFCHRGVLVPQVGLVYAGSAYYRANPRLFAPYGGELTGMRGLLQNLLDCQQAVEITMEHHLRGRLREYPLIVYPEWASIDPSFRDELLAYVRDGGRLLVVGPRAAALFDDVSGVRREGEPTDAMRWLEHDGQLSAVKTWTARAGPRGTAATVQNGPAVHDAAVETFGSIHDRDDFTTDASPAATIATLGRGRLACVWLNLGERYLNARTLVARDFLASLVRRLVPEPLVEVAGSRTVDVVPARLRNRLHVHLVNTAGPHEDPDVYTFDEVQAVGPLEVTIRLPRRPARIVRQPTGEALKVQWQEGAARVRLPRLALHEILVVD